MTLRRALRLYAAWLLAIVLHILVRVALVFCIPILFIWSAYGMRWTQRSAQASFDMTCLFLTRRPRFPRVSLVSKKARRRPADDRVTAKARGKTLPLGD